MTIQLVKLQNEFILVSDEEIIDVRPHNGKWHLEKGIIINQFPTYLTDLSECKLIIAGIPELPSIDFSLLNEEDCKTIGYNHWSRHWEIVNSQIENGVNPHAYRLGFITAQSLSGKIFSLEDITKAIHFGEMSVKDSSIILFEKKGLVKTKVTEQFIQSLQQPSWNVEIEMEGCKGICNKIAHDYSDEAETCLSGCEQVKPKITNNSIKILKIKV